jgi:ribosome-binding factor A
VKEYPRKLRLNVQFQRELAGLIREELRDPRLMGVTLTRVDVAPDLRNANVFVSALGTDAQAAQAVKALDGAAGRLRKGLSRNLKLRLVPQLHFRLDAQLREADRLSTLIKDAVHADQRAAADRESD